MTTKTIAYATGLLATAAMLGGCQSFLGNAFASKSREPASAADVDLSGYFAERLEAGRLHLKANRPAQAAIAFRQASYDPKVAAEAFNGMAVAYAQIGRRDLAAQFFELAMQRAPDDERFARNFARLEASVPAPAAVPAAPVEALAQAEPAAPVRTVEQRRLPGGLTLAIGTTAAPIERVSAREVHIGGGAQAAAPVAVAKAAPQPKVYAVRALTPSRSTSTVRVGFGPEKGAQDRPAVYAITSAPAKAQYPVRVALGPKQED